MTSRTVRVVLDYLYPWPNSAGLFVARDRGWYTEAGLDVELRVHDYGWGDTLEYLSRGQAEFGLFPPNRLLVRRERGERVVAVAAVNHEGLEAVQVAVKSGVKRPRDLAGRRVGYTPTPRGRAMVAGIVAADGGDPATVQTVDTGATELTPEFLAASGLDATFGGYWSWDALTADPVAAEQTLVWPMRAIAPARYHSYVLGTAEALVETDQDLVRAFLAATARGYAAAAADPERTVDLLSRVTPYIPPWRLARSLSLVIPTWFHDGRWGQLRGDLVAGYADFLAGHGILAAPQGWAAAVTTEFLPAR
jgi:ABC-type nitrate/sulfonate/bicarbonate transport system substrate-binding protein